MRNKFYLLVTLFLLFVFSISWAQESEFGISLGYGQAYGGFGAAAGWSSQSPEVLADLWGGVGIFDSLVGGAMSIRFLLGLDRNELSGLYLGGFWGYGLIGSTTRATFSNYDIDVKKKAVWGNSFGIATEYVFSSRFSIIGDIGLSLKAKGSPGEFPSSIPTLNSGVKYVF
jgi:hypothetical protein